MAGLRGMTEIVITDMIRGSPEPVQIRNGSGQTNFMNLTDLHKIFMSGKLENVWFPSSEGELDCRSVSSALLDIQKVSFVGEPSRIRPVVTTDDIQDCTHAVLKTLSLDYAENFNKITFWFLQHISTGAIVGVVRHSWLMDCIMGNHVQNTN